ncbi:hypothetical protein B0A52_02251 [Exophiala mesophila]|uniref:Mid2 domain-containing protein n=1 Tax=Exophiala mesophila TaxID=212818 RepID=A0A438NBG9_EXOME|nr:hypothetical protein B0A52_02251 [Exophiala mesophila]
MYLGGTVQDLWISPAPPDFSTNLTIGEFFTIRWDSSLADSLSIYAPSADPTSVDLWITDYNLHIYSKRIAARQSIRAVTTISWLVEVAENELLATNRWVFRWLPQGVAYSDTAEQLSSPGFFIQNLTAPSSTTYSSSTSTLSSTSTQPYSSTSEAETVTTTSAGSSGSTASSAPPSDVTLSVEGSSGGSLSTGAKAGIAIGAVAGAALLLGIGWFIARKSARPNTNDSTIIPDNSQVPPTYSSAQLAAKSNHAPSPQYAQIYPAELEHQNVSLPAQELPGHGHYR